MSPKRSRRKSPLASRRTRNWKSDAEYVADQDRESSWSSCDNPWGTASAIKFIKFGHYLGDRLCHDDTVADFGGNDGYPAYSFYLEHKIKPLVVDCEPKRLDHAAKAYGLSTYESFIETMKELGDKSIDWGYCSHTLEHTRDTAKAMREIARIIKRGCYFVIPLEDLSHARKNHAHAICFTQKGGWTRLLRRNGWKVLAAEKTSKYECQIYAEPK